MFRKCIFSQNTHVKSLWARRFSTKIDIEKLEQENATTVDVLDDEARQREEEIERKRNKSRLHPAHRNIVLNQVPYKEPVFWTHETVKYARKMYGRYGKASGVDPSLCWPTKQELEDRIEYEKVAFPTTIPQMIEKAQKERKEKTERIMKRQEEIANNLTKLQQWKKELHDRIAKKEADERAAKERKERLIEEVRRHFGFTVDPRDEKFKEMLEKKEKEQKKAMKEAKRKAKEEKMLSKLIGKKVDTSSAELEGSQRKEEATKTKEEEKIEKS